jgi:hypothetical protein
MRAETASQCHLKRTRLDAHSANVYREAWHNGQRRDRIVVVDGKEQGPSALVRNFKVPIGLTSSGVRIVRHRSDNLSRIGSDRNPRGTTVNVPGGVKPHQRVRAWIARDTFNGAPMSLEEASVSET